MSEVIDAELSRLLGQVRDAGVELWVEGGRLRFRAEAGALTDDMRTGLRDRKADVIEALLKEATATVAERPMALGRHAP